MPPGWSVSMSGISLLGGRSVDVQEGDGPRIRLNAYAIFGGIEVKEPKLAVD